MVQRWNNSIYMFDIHWFMYLELKTSI